eukprot:1158434-Pelagomonas_calceolata.AAC.4
MTTDLCNHYIQGARLSKVAWGTSSRGPLQRQAVLLSSVCGHRQRTDRLPSLQSLSTLLLQSSLLQRFQIPASPPQRPAHRRAPPMKHHKKRASPVPNQHNRINAAAAARTHDFTDSTGCTHGGHHLCAGWAGQAGLGSCHPVKGAGCESGGHCCCWVGRMSGTKGSSCVS